MTGSSSPNAGQTEKTLRERERTFAKGETHKTCLWSFTFHESFLKIKFFLFGLLMQYWFNNRNIPFGYKYSFLRSCVRGTMWNMKNHDSHENYFYEKKKKSFIPSKPRERKFMFIQKIVLLLLLGLISGLLRPSVFQANFTQKIFSCKRTFFFFI